MNRTHVAVKRTMMSGHFEVIVSFLGAFLLSFKNSSSIQYNPPTSLFLLVV